MIYDTAIAVEPEFEADLLRHTKTWAEIDLGALRRNYHRIRDFVQRHSPQCETMCILKADAYGHGAVMCAKALWSEGVRLFGVSCITEAIQLRSALGMDADVTILILGYTLPSDVDLLYKYHISQTVFSLEYAHQLCDEINYYILKLLDLIMLIHIFVTDICNISLLYSISHSPYHLARMNRQP